MSSPDENYVSRNNYNFALNEEFDYLDELSEELKKADKIKLASADPPAGTIAAKSQKETGSGDSKPDPKPE